MSQPKVLTSRMLSGPTIVSTFIGMVMAVPLTIGISSLANNAGALPNEQAVAESTTADFAKFAYAFNQGYQASAVSTTSGAVACVDVPSQGAGAGAVSAAAVSMPAGAQSEATVTYGRGSGGTAWSTPVKPVIHRADKHGSDLAAHMVNSYNSYTSMVHNSSSVSYTNSNNVVGSNNSNSTKIEVEDAHNVAIGVDNTQSAVQMQANESFNHDSYNTETNTLINNDSFNEETNVAINSGNTVTENTAINHVEESYNTETDVDMEMETETNTTTTNTTVNNTENSHNTNSIEVEDVKLEVELEL